MNQLKPCPFCGHTEPELTPHEEADWVSHEDTDEEGFFVICSVNKGGCGATSGWKLEEADVIDLWNQRQGEN